MILFLKLFSFPAFFIHLNSIDFISFHIRHPLPLYMFSLVLFCNFKLNNKNDFFKVERKSLEINFFHAE